MNSGYGLPRQPAHHGSMRACCACQPYRVVVSSPRRCDLLPCGREHLRSGARRLRTQLVTKDQDLALLAAKIFKLNETIRAPAHRIPIIHHATVAMFPAYPSLDVL